MPNIKGTTNSIILNFLAELSSYCTHTWPYYKCKYVAAAWLKSELKKMQIRIPNSIHVEKLTGDNTRGEKERVMELFKEGWGCLCLLCAHYISCLTCCSKCQVLVCTDVAGMGIDVKDLNFSINIGKFLCYLCLVWFIRIFRHTQEWVEDETAVWSYR